MKNIDKPEILIATNNAGKLAEFERLLGTDYFVRGLAGLDLELPPEGTTSYKENADAKAIYVADATGKLTLGDDSGLEVAALDGAPGITSARFAGEPPSDQRNIDKLLGILSDRQVSDRSARFVCWLALADSDGLISSVEGRCHGQVGHNQVGSNGFGYDPVFMFSSGRTMAELTDQEKDDVSHRGNAVRAMKPVLDRAARRSTGNA